MAEFRLDGLALEKLHVVDQQKIDIAQGFLQRQGGVIVQGLCEDPHEIVRRQVAHLLGRVAQPGLPSDRL